MRRGSADSIRPEGKTPHQQAGYNAAMCLRRHANAGPCELGGVRKGFMKSPKVEDVYLMPFESAVDIAEHPPLHNTAFGCAVERRPPTAGANPARLTVAPAGSYRSG